jgi:hypothetical protein
MPGAVGRANAMKRIVREVIFLTVAAVIILPAPTILFAYVTGKTIAEVMYR